MRTFTYYVQESFTCYIQEKCSHHGKEILHGYLELYTNKKERIYNQEIKMPLLCVKALALMSLKVQCHNAKSLTLNVKNIWLISHSGVENFTCLVSGYSLPVLLRPFQQNWHQGSRITNSTEIKINFFHSFKNETTATMIVSCNTKVHRHWASENRESFDQHHWWNLVVVHNKFWASRLWNCM